MGPGRAAFFSIVLAWLFMLLFSIGWLCVELNTPETVWAPIFFASSVAFAAAAVLEIKVRRFEKGRVRMCRECGYDLAGLQLGVRCPECGVTSTADAEAL